MNANGTLNTYQTAMMLAGQFYLVLESDTRVKRGTVIVVQPGSRKDDPEGGVYYNPKDSDPASVGL